MLNLLLMLNNVKCFNVILNVNDILKVSLGYSKSEHTLHVLLDAGVCMSGQNKVL